MREVLKRFEGLTREFNGEVGAKGICRSDKKSKVVCLVNIKFKDAYITDHSWIFDNKEEFIKIKKGVKISFVADVKSYLKRIDGKIVKDYCLTNVKCVKIL